LDVTTTRDNLPDLHRTPPDLHIVHPMGEKPLSSLAALRLRRSDLFTAEQKRQAELIPRVEKINVK